MSEPQKLQHRLAAAFTEPATVPVGETVDDLFPTGERAASPHEPGHTVPEAIPERPGVLRFWLAGAALVAAALFLSAGPGPTSLAFALSFCAVSAGALLYPVFGRLRGRTGAGVAAGIGGAPRADPAGSSHAAAGAMFGAIHDALGDITLCRDTNGVILSANNTFRRLTRCERPEGRTCEQLGILFQPRDVPHCYDVAFSTAAGIRTYLWHDVVTRDLVLGDLVIQSIARDVTAERRDALVREEARARAEEESGIKSRLIATVSHEIRTPLSGLLGMGQLLARTGLSPEQKNYLDGISQSGTALVQLVEDLLDFSTLAAGRFRLRPREEAVRPLIESVVELLSSRAHAKGIEIGAIISPGLPEALTFDPARFRQVLYNVIGNAVKFTEEGGVLVSAALEDGCLIVRVRDTGPGMDASEMQRIFGEFEQGSISSAREGGVGLGLAISARIMAEARGALSVESAIGEGSTFTIRLPVATDSTAMRQGNELQASRVLLLAPLGPASTALVESLRALGAETAIASTAAEAESILVARRFTGIIIDHRLEPEFMAGLNRNPHLAGAKRIYLVNPESRPAQMSGSDYDSWLIRPLREQSLIDVLTGKLRGLEHRAAASEAFPVLTAHPAEEQPTPVEPVAASGLSILLGEDEPVNAMIARAILEKAGHRVLLAENFARLAEVLESEPVDLLLSDYSMPDGTSEEFIGRLRKREKAAGSSALPVIVLTADNTDETRRKLLASGADLVLSKPATPDILDKAIRHVGDRLTRAA